MAARDALSLLSVDQRPGDVQQGIHLAEVYAELLESQDMDDFDIPARRGQSRDKGKRKAHTAEPGRHSVSGRPGVIRIHDDMDDFDIPARRGQSRDKGKGKAHAAEPGRHSVSGRPDDMDDFDIPARRGHFRDKGKGKASEEFNAELARKGKWPRSTQLTHEMNVLFLVEHLQQLVRQGQWQDAKLYIGNIAHWG
uniref:PH01B019A14.13 protein n=1 Tax=Phyllostachys edulis TaxID=38705 RepID=L0P1N4_PHYED|nr:PH01B019A14.13 [Phyllostachys edulis]